MPVTNPPIFVFKEGDAKLNQIIAKRMFFTKGVGYHRDKLQSFELALRDAGVAYCNLVQVSSIFPPECRIIPREAGVKSLKPGQITFVVMARESTDEPNRLCTAAIGLAQPKDKKQYGYISEHHGFGETQKKSADYAEDLAAQMLGSTMGIELDPNLAWDEHRDEYKVDNKNVFVSRSIAQSARGHKDGLWTTVVSMAVFLMSE